MNFVTRYKFVVNKVPHGDHHEGLAEGGEDHLAPPVGTNRPDVNHLLNQGETE
jgi:hypothetical protein